MFSVCLSYNINKYLLIILKDEVRTSVVPDQIQYYLQLAQQQAQQQQQQQQQQTQATAQAATQVQTTAQIPQATQAVGGIQIPGDLSIIKYRQN